MCEQFKNFEVHGIKERIKIGMYQSLLPGFCFDLFQNQKSFWYFWSLTRLKLYLEMPSLSVDQTFSLPAK